MLGHSFIQHAHSAYVCVCVCVICVWEKDPSDPHPPLVGDFWGVGHHGHCPDMV